MTPYQTRANIRRQISTRIQKSRYFRVSLVADGDNPSSKKLTVVGKTISRIETDSSVLFGGAIGTVTQFDTEANTLNVFFETPPEEVPGTLEVWDPPFDVESVNQLIDSVIVGAIDLGHRVHDSYTDWWLPAETYQSSREIQIPAHIDTLTKIRSNREYCYPRRLLIMEDDISLPPEAAPGKPYVTLATHTTGRDWLLFATQLPGNSRICTVSMNEQDWGRDTVLFGLSANRDMVVRVSDGVNERRIALEDGVYRIIPFKRPEGLSPFDISVYHDSDETESFTLHVVDRFSLVGKSTLRESLSMDNWAVNKNTRSLSVNLNAPSELLIEGWRLPKTVTSDDDVVEVPGDYMIDNCSALLLTSEIQQAALDTEGNNQRASVLLRERASKERYLDRPAYGRYVMYRSRDAIVEDVGLELTLTVGYIALPGDPHVATETFQLSRTPFEVSVDLPDEDMYLSIEWSGGSDVTRIFIDGLDQTHAFTIGNNRAVSNAPVVSQDDDTDILIRVE